jgi:uncharacterized membrane protein
MIYLKEYLVAVVVFFLIDMLWLGVIAKDLYAKELGHLLTSNINWIAAIIFYLLFVVGIVFFVIHPAIEKNSLSYALIAGLMFGFMTYATYDLTNLATLKDWPLKIVFIDIAWGSFLSASVSVVTYYVLNILKWFS